MLPVVTKSKFTFKNKYLKNGKIDLTPFTIASEEIYLLAKDGTEEEQLAAMRSIVESCILTNDVDVGQIPFFVIEEIFLRLREKSAGEIINSRYICKNKFTPADSEEEKECGNFIDAPIDLRKVKLVEEKTHSNIVMVTDSIGIKFKYPTLDGMEAGMKRTQDSDFIIDSIDCIFDGDEVHKKEENGLVTRDEFVAFYKDLELNVKSDIFSKFVLTQPHLHYESNYKCSKCGFEHKFSFNSLSEIFQ